MMMRALSRSKTWQLDQVGGGASLRGADTRLMMVNFMSTYLDLNGQIVNHYSECVCEGIFGQD